MQLEHKYDKHGALNDTSYNTAHDTSHEDSLHHALHQLDEDDI